MKKLYFIAFLTLLVVQNITSQTTISYPQQTSNYYANFIDASSGSGLYNNGGTELGMYAHTDGAKQVVAWRNFTEDGTTGSTPSTMAVGDSFTITVQTTRAFGQIGIALLASPSATSNWNDRQNNYAVQVNLNGNGGAYDPWEIVSSGGTVNTSSINGVQNVFNELIIKFTLNTATAMEVSLNNGAEIFNITVNNQNITGYSIYLADDWDGDSHENIYWKPTTEYRYATTLPVEEFIINTISLNLIDNKIQIEGLEYNQKFKLAIYDLNGRLIKKMNEKSKLNLNELSSAVYILKLKTENNSIISKKVIKI